MPHSALEKLREITTSDAIFKLNAVAYKKTFDALVSEGFTPEMALQIVVGRGPAIDVNGNGSGK